MLKYKHVLLATDLSANSNDVADSAKKMASGSHTKLSIVHVVEQSPIAYGGEFSVPVDANLEETIEHQAGEALSDLAKQLKVPQDRIHLKVGSVKNEVGKLADEIEADCIVVGTHGRHGIELLLGSNANAILHVAKCDVLAVRVQNEDE